MGSRKSSSKKKKLSEVSLEQQADKLLSDAGFEEDVVSSSLQDSSLDNVVSTAVVETSVDNKIETQDSSLVNVDVSTTSVENQNNVLEISKMSEVATVDAGSKAEVSKKKLVLDFIAANPELAGKNKEIAAALVALGHDVKAEQVAAIKAQNKAKEEKSSAPKFDMSSFKQLFTMQKRLNDAGGIEAIESALAVVEPLLVEVGSIDNLKFVLSTLKEVEALP